MAKSSVERLVKRVEVDSIDFVQCSQTGWTVSLA